MGERGIIKLNNKVLKTYISEITGTPLEALEQGVTEVELAMFVENIYKYGYALNQHYDQFLVCVKEFEKEVVEAKALFNGYYSSLTGGILSMEKEKVQQVQPIQEAKEFVKSVEMQDPVQTEYVVEKEEITVQEMYPESLEKEHMPEKEETVQQTQVQIPEYTNPLPQQPRVQNAQDYIFGNSQDKDAKPLFVLPQRVEKKEEPKVQQVMEEKPLVIPRAQTQPIGEQRSVEYYNESQYVNPNLQNNKAKPTMYLGVNPHRTDNFNKGTSRPEQMHPTYVGPEAVNRFDSMQTNLYDTYKERGFGEEQLDLIKRAIAAEVDVHKLTDYDLNARQMEEVLKGLKKGINVNPYLSNQFTAEQMKLLRVAAEKKVDISQFAYPDLSLDELTFNVAIALYPTRAYSIHQFDAAQLKEIRAGIWEEKKDINIGIYFNPEFDHRQMYQIKRGLMKGLDASKYADPKLTADEMNIKMHNMQLEVY